tara:strand:- start:2972 stop:3328 length:357 start_codon:yes stop_codon:yes gene_type:complete
MLPHRISLFESCKKCDICKKEENVLSISILEKGIGYYICNDQRCKLKLNELIEQNTVDIKTLKENFTEPLKIKRSNNIIEDGWMFNSNGIREDNDIWIQVKKDKFLKEVLLSEIELYN